jgi:hypothetical protein
VHRREEREHDRGDTVGDGEDDILRRVGVRERGVAHTQQEREE